MLIRTHRVTSIFSHHHQLPSFQSCRHCHDARLLFSSTTLLPSTPVLNSIMAQRTPKPIQASPQLSYPLLLLIIPPGCRLVVASTVSGPGHIQADIVPETTSGFYCFCPFALFFGLGPGFLLTGLGSLSSPLSSVSEVFLGLGLGLGPGFFLADGAASGPSDVSETDLRFVDQVVRAGAARYGGKASSSPSEGGAMGVREVGNSRGSSDFEEDKGLDSWQVSG
jgi:hypothetical protein